MSPVPKQSPNPPAPMMNKPNGDVIVNGQTVAPSKKVKLYHKLTQAEIDALIDKKRSEIEGG